jgi:hypothetical protein
LACNVLCKVCNNGNPDECTECKADITIRDAVANTCTCKPDYVSSNGCVKPSGNGTCGYRQYLNSTTKTCADCPVACR